MSHHSPNGELRKEVNRLESHMSNVRDVEFQLQVKVNEIESIKLKYEQIRTDSTIQDILNALGSVNQSSKSDIAKRLIESGLYYTQ